MNLGNIEQALQKEMNRRRRRGGAEDVPIALWSCEEVAASVQQIVTICDSEEFDGDWDQASLPVEEGMDRLAVALRKASLKQNAHPPVFKRWGTSPGRSMQQITRSQEEASAGKGYCYFPYFPSIIRQDIEGEALAEYLSWHWQNHGWAAALCEEVCGGEYLSREAAWTFLTSDLPKVLGYDDYKRLGLCPAKAKGRTVSKFLKIEGLFFTTDMVRADPKTHLVTATTETLSTETGHHCMEVSMPKDHTSIRRLKRLVLTRDADPYYYVTARASLPGSYIVEYGQGRDSFLPPHPVPFFQGRNRYVEGYAASVMADLIGIAEAFMGEYSVSIWDMLEACLTGQFPPQPSILISTSQTKVTDAERPDEISTGKALKGFTAQGPATLTVQSWVTPEVLADAWRELRKNHSCYSPSEKQADALHFVLSHTPPGEEFAWEKLARQWQEERGELMTRGQLLKQFHRAWAAILPGYTEEKRKENPPGRK